MKGGGVEYGMKKEQNVSVKKMGEGRKSTRERVIQSEREADGDEGLERVAKPLRRKKDKTLWIHCVERQGIKGGRTKGSGEKQGRWKAVAGEGVMGAGRERKTTKERELSGGKD